MSNYLQLICFCLLFVICLTHRDAESQYNAEEDTRRSISEIDLPMLKQARMMDQLLGNVEKTWSRRTNRRGSQLGESLLLTSSASSSKSPSRRKDAEERYIERIEERGRRSYPRQMLDRRTTFLEPKEGSGQSLGAVEEYLPRFSWSQEGSGLLHEVAEPEVTLERPWIVDESGQFRIIGETDVASEKSRAVEGSGQFNCIIEADGVSEKSWAVKGSGQFSGTIGADVISEKSWTVEGSGQFSGTIGADVISEKSRTVEGSGYHHASDVEGSVVVEPPLLKESEGSERAYGLGRLE